ncbi:protein of unknown function DUF1725 containing protein [Cricetulus griseus]|nr:protein of unknown function DUF1725 containing protein [Cricetulus griseus]
MAFCSRSTEKPAAVNGLGAASVLKHPPNFLPVSMIEIKPFFETPNYISGSGDDNDNSESDDGDNDDNSDGDDDSSDADDGDGDDGNDDSDGDGDDDNSDGDDGYDDDDNDGDGSDDDDDSDRDDDGDGDSDGDDSDYDSDDDDSKEYDLMKFSVKWMELEKIILNEIAQTYLLRVGTTHSGLDLPTIRKRLTDMLTEQSNGNNSSSD